MVKCPDFASFNSVFVTLSLQRDDFNTVGLTPALKSDCYLVIIPKCIEFQ